ncbi:MAG: AmmeMemoRadiSam system protein A [Gammaproteobacteria bacterium]|nr:AmmeMemoRadiSam system protein A [Gammaproteobacteria bacterium]
MFADAAAACLLAVGRCAVERGLGTRTAPGPELAGCPPELFAAGACFVTLTTAEGGLRGCRGVVEPCRGLAEEVWYSAWASAFDDPRFEPVTAGELAGLRLEISVLGPLELVPVASEAELCDVLVPGHDGVVLAWRGRRATFLPQVWDDLPAPRDFLGHLRRKAGLPDDFWAPDIAFSRYRVRKIAGEAGHFRAVESPATTVSSA